MRFNIGVTDGDWFRTLSALGNVDEVNFWQPSGRKEFGVLQPGELFLFKLHSPNNFIVGGGIFAYASLLPVSLAWQAFGEKNGVGTFAEMRTRIAHYRRSPENRFADYTIGCILLQQPFFLPRDRWIPIPPDFSLNIVQGKSYDAASDIGRSVLKSLSLALEDSTPIPAAVNANSARYGEPTLVTPRLGQGSFRVVVTDAYDRRCALTRERTLPVLDAAHIVPYANGGEHRVDNGLLMRSDIHTLFDRGYVTVTPDYRVEISKRIREEFENGRDYYALHGSTILLPRDSGKRPSAESLRTHNDNIFLG